MSGSPPQSLEDQESALSQAKATAEGKLSEVKQQAADEERQVMQTQTSVALANAKLKGEVAAQTKELRLKLLDRMTALHTAMATSLAQIRSELEGKVDSDQKTLETDVGSAKATATGVMDSVKADLLQTQTEAKKSEDKSKAELAQVAESEKALSTRFLHPSRVGTMFGESRCFDGRVASPPRASGGLVFS